MKTEDCSLVGLFLSYEDFFFFLHSVSSVMEAIGYKLTGRLNPRTNYMVEWTLNTNYLSTICFKNNAPPSTGLLDNFNPPF